MNIMDGNINAMATHRELDVFVDWHHNAINWSANQKAFAYLPSGFRIDFCLAQLGRDLEDIHVDDLSQMASTMADIAGSLYVAIFGMQAEDFDRDENDDDDEDEGFRW